MPTLRVPRFPGEVKDAVTPRATLLVLGVVALQLLFIASYVGALHDPKPKDVSFGVVAPQAAARQTVTRLERLPGVFGIVGIGLAILLVVIAGDPSAGGAFPLPMLPPFWHAIGPALPPGAGTWTARSIAYFEGNDTTASLLVLSAWAVAGIVITLLAAGLRGGRQPRQGVRTARAVRTRQTEGTA